MQVTLKRADFYARAALEAATETKYDPALRLSIYAPSMTTETPVAVESEIKAARDKLVAPHELSIALIRANYAIRAALADANVRLGISTRLTENAQLAAEENRVRALIKAIDGATDGEITPHAVLARAKSNREKTSERLYGREDTVTANVLTETDLEMLRKQLKRIVDERGGLADALTALNVSNKVTLDARTVETLQKADILPT